MYIYRHRQSIFKYIRNLWLGVYCLKFVKCLMDQVLSQCLTFMASVTVLIMMSIKIPYSNGCDVTNHQILYWHRAFGMYRRCGLDFNANSIHFLYKTQKQWLCISFTIMMTFCLKIYRIYLYMSISHRLSQYHMNYKQLGQFVYS